MESGASIHVFITSPRFTDRFLFLSSLTLSLFILPSHQTTLEPDETMPNPPPAWVQALKPASPQGTELLTQERAQSNIDVDTLGDLLHTKEALKKQDEILSVLKSEKVFDKSRNHVLGRTEKIQLALARGKRLQQLKKVHNWSDEDVYVANDLVSEPTPYALHASMFLVCTPW